MQIRLLALSDAGAVSRELMRLGCPPHAARTLAPMGVCRVVHLTAVPADIAGPLRTAMQAQGGDAAISPAGDVVLLGTEAQVTQACWASEMPGDVGQSLLDVLQRAVQPTGVLHCGAYSLPLGAKTYVMGILNMTPDSFSGEGLGSDVDRALRQAEQMVADGADLLDVGGESTRPGADPVSLEEELHRVAPVIRAVAARFPVPVSVDTYKSAVARAAVEAGASMINDISGLRFDPAMAAVVAAARVPVVVMHIQGTPRTMQQHPVYADLMGEIDAYLRESTAIAEAAGVPRGQVVLDPGFGFGKTAAQNLELLRRLRELTFSGQPVLIGTSRKSTIGAVLGGLPATERLEGTAATVAVGIVNGADIVRVHDVKAMTRVAVMTDAIVRPACQP